MMSIPPGMAIAGAGKGICAEGLARCQGWRVLGLRRICAELSPAGVVLPGRNACFHALCCVHGVLFYNFTCRM